MYADEAENRKKTRRLRTVVLVAALLSLSVFGVQLSTRRFTIAEVVAWTRWSPGMVPVEGWISQIGQMNTSQGPLTLLAAEPDGDCGGLTSLGTVVGEPGAEYRVGSRFQGTLRFREFTFNGVPAVAADNLICPFPLLFASIGVVMDAVSLVGGLGLLYGGTDAQDWTTYEIITPHRDEHPLAIGPVTLEAESLSFDAGTRIESMSSWVVAGAVDYVWITGHLGGNLPSNPVDAMQSLADGTSPGGRLRFVDADQDGRVGDGDSIRVRLDATPNGYQRYLLRIGSLGMGALGGAKAILNGPDGPYELLVAGTPTPWMQLAHVEEAAGPVTRTTIEVGRTMGEPWSWSDFDYLLTLGRGANRSTYQAPLMIGEQTIGLGYSLAVADAAADGIVGTGDRFVLSGLPSNSSAELSLIFRGTGARAGSISWFPGYGYVPRLPYVTLNGSGTNPYTFVSSVSFPHPEFNLGKGLSVLLTEDGATVLDRVSLNAGTFASWPGGNLTFSDLDGDGSWSDGDEFRIAATTPRRYRLVVSLLWDTHSYAGEAGP